MKEAAVLDEGIIKWDHWIDPSGDYIDVELNPLTHRPDPAGHSHDSFLKEYYDEWIQPNYPELAYSDQAEDISFNALQNGWVRKSGYPGNMIYTIAPMRSSLSRVESSVRQAVQELFPYIDPEIDPQDLSPQTKQDLIQMTFYIDVMEDNSSQKNLAEFSALDFVQENMNLMNTVYKTNQTRNFSRVRSATKFDTLGMHRAADLIDASLAASIS